MLYSALSIRKCMFTIPVFVQEAVSHCVDLFSNQRTTLFTYAFPQILNDIVAISTLREEWKSVIHISAPLLHQDLVLNTRFFLYVSPRLSQRMSKRKTYGTVASQNVLLRIG